MSELARDNPIFMEHFKQELNLKLDLETLTVDSHKPFTYESECGVETVQVRIFIKYAELCISGKYFAKNWPVFMENVLPEYNPDIDYETWSIVSNKKINIIIRGDKNKRKTLQTVAFFSDPEKHCSNPRKQITNTKRGLLSENEQFMKYFDPELNPDFDPSLYTERAMISIVYTDSYGNVGLKTIRNIMKSLNAIEAAEERKLERLFKELERLTYPRTNEVIPGVNDAATIDPEIEAFWSTENKKSCHEVSMHYKHVKLVCPTCGHKFERSLKNFVGKHPKCPNRDCPSRNPSSTDESNQDDLKIAEQFRFYLNLKMESMDFDS